MNRFLDAENISLISCTTVCLSLLSWQGRYDARRCSRPTGELTVSTNGSLISLNEPPSRCALLGLAVATAPPLRIKLLIKSFIVTRIMLQGILTVNFLSADFLK